MSGAVLWKKVADEVSLPGPLGETAQARLTAVFAPAGSPWARALARLGLARPPGTLLRFVEGIPYFSATAIAYAVSQGSAVPEPTGSGDVAYTSRGGLLATLRQLRAQWKVESYLAGLSAELPLGEAAVEESVALGLVVQLLLLRLPAGTQAELPRFLANPLAAPAHARATLRKILSLQGRRTALSAAWAAIYEGVPSEPLPELPSQFWDPPGPTSSRRETAEVSAPRSRWKGIPICPGLAEGELVPGGAAPGVKLFPQARPDTVAHFAGATALLFAEGGALAHACCVAREMGIPAVSGLGKEFLRQARERGRGRVRVDGATGEVEFL